MTTPSTFLSKLLMASGNGYASCAADRLLERLPQAAEAFGEDGWRGWRGFIAGRISELAAAAAAEQPQLFAGQLRWARTAFTSRGVPITWLREATRALREVLVEELPASVQGLADTTLAEALHALDEDDRSTANFTQTYPLAARFLAALHGGDRRAAWQAILDVAARGTPLEDIYEDGLFPAMAEIGRLWHTNEISVAHEHFATMATQLLLPQLMPFARRVPPHGKAAIIASMSGNEHDLASRVIADLLEIDGWRSILLGANVPPADLIEAATAFGAELLVLSVALPNQLGHLRSTIGHVRQRELAIRVLAGGGALSPALAESIGVDAWARWAREAPPLARRLVGLPASAGDDGPNPDAGSTAT